MNNNPYENETSGKSPFSSEENPYAEPNPYKENIFLTESEEDVVSAYSSENVDFDDTQVIDISEGDKAPVQSEYVYPYAESAPSETEVEEATVAQPHEMSSYEWYGKNPAPTEEKNTDCKDVRNKKRDKRVPVAVLLLVCMLVSVLFGSGAAILTNHFLSPKNTSTQTVVVDNNGGKDKDYTNSNTIVTTPQTDELLTTQIVEMYADSVVEIVTEYIETGVFSQQYIQSGAGSGVIIDTRGYIVTNHHVIENAQRIYVTLRNGTSYEAEFIGSDSKMDLAVLKIDAKDLTTAVIGDSDTLKVGQRTIAIGNPLGQLGGTVTEGIISALDRDVTVDGQTMNLLQTDTAINPGNSGGGLFDQCGNLIGVVVAKSSGSEVEGLGFAIPVNDAMVVISDLMEYGYVRGRVDIGMEFLDVDSESVAWMYGLSSLGCYVYSVDAGSNAAEAGFKSGDLILKVDGEEVDYSDDVEKILDEKELGDTVKFTVKRGRSTGELELVLEEYVPNNFTDDDFDERDD